MAYKLDDFVRAEQQVEACQRRIEKHRASNPSFGRDDLREAQRRLRAIVSDLKTRGVLPKTMREMRDAERDAQRP